MNTDLIFYVLASACIVIGLLGTTLPVLPGIPLIFAGMAVIAWLGNFQSISEGTMTVLALFTLAAIAVDVCATVLGAKRVGASRKAMIGAGLGSLAGLFFGLPGLVIGPYFGAMAGEMTHAADWRHAARVGLGTWLGIAAGVVIKLMLAAGMLAVFFAALWLP